LADDYCGEQMPNTSNGLADDYFFDDLLADTPMVEVEDDIPMKKTTL
jgi:hypothetical protein